MKNLNKKGVVATGVIIALIIFGILAAGGIAYGVMQRQEGELPEGIGTCPDSAATVSFTAKNALSKGTAVTVGANVSVNGGPFATSATSYAVGADLETFWSATDYLNKVDKATVECGGGPITTEMYATDDGAFRIWASNGGLATNGKSGLGTINQTALGSGGSKNLKIAIDGNDKQSTGDLLVVVEVNMSTTFKDPTLTLGTDGDVPSYYSVANTGAKAVAFDVPAVMGADSVEGTLNLAAKTGQTACGGINVTAYSKQAFEDVDGSIVTDIENADGTAQYEDIWSYYFYVDCA